MSPESSNAAPLFGEEYGDKNAAIVKQIETQLNAAFPGSEFEASYSLKSQKLSVQRSGSELVVECPLSQISIEEVIRVLREALQTKTAPQEEAKEVA